ncbi:MAG: TetR/AcrR family transcriptional regulator [Solirubrobacterales bacterium]|nr:TetR/AcrR family transcriptional regulator [Solirubrobacterales bacterium]
MSSMTRPVRPPRRTQAERREATRTALLEATIECLIDYGYAGTTTARVAELAGVSRGAQIHYFANKAALVAAAVDHLAQRRTEEFRTRLLGVPAGPGWIETLLDALWEAHQDELFDATLELWVAARTDPELRPLLAALERGVAQSVARLAAELFATQPERTAAREDIEFATATVRGLALLRIAGDGDGRAATRRWHRARERLIGLFD